MLNVQSGSNKAAAVLLLRAGAEPTSVGDGAGTESGAVGTRSAATVPDEAQGGTLYPNIRFALNSASLIGGDYDTPQWVTCDK